MENKIIDITKEEWKDLPEDLNGLVYLSGSIKNGILVKEYKTFEEIKKEEVNKIDKQTREKIINIANEDKQRTYLARYNYLIEQKINNSITVEEQEEMNKLKEIWLNINNLIKEGNLLEQKVLECKTEEEIYSLINT